MAKCIVYKDSKVVSLQVIGDLDIDNMSITTDEGETYPISHLLNDFDGTNITLKVSSKNEEELMIPAVD